MLSMKEILELSNDMSVEIIDNIDNKHYIINERGQSIEFDLDMLMCAVEIAKNCEYAECIRNGEQR